MRSITYKFGLLLFLLCGPLGALAQSSIDEYLKTLNLNQALYPPEDILKTKSLVLISVPMDDAPNEWQEILDEMQQFFAEYGVDAVAYLMADRFDVAQNVPQAFPDFTFKRGIQNLIILSAHQLKGPIFIAITPFNNQESMYSKGASAFARLTSDLSSVWQELGTSFRTDQFQRTNLLVNENPEFFYPKVEPGIVARSIPPQVAEFKIAMKPVDANKYEALPVYKIQHDYLFRRDSILQTIREQNQTLEALSVDSTNTMSLVALDENDATLRRAGFIYELKMVKGPEALVYDWISFPDRPKPSNRMVYKFYLDDLRTNTIFIGKEWDAAPTWQEALAAFVAQIREAAAKGN